MLDGFLVVDKPAGVTSHDVVAILRRACGQKKIGHTGTLDPFATGVLPVALGEATKAIPYLDESIKEYRATMRLGITTDTQDLEGEMLEERDWHHVTNALLDKVFDLFRGAISQLPPMFSALKRDGVPLYKIARKGGTVERAERPVTIHSLAMDRIELPEIDFTVRCSRGTYVRTLANDIGERLGCGAHLLQLRRTQSGPFALGEAFPLAELTGSTPEIIGERFLKGIMVSLAHLPEIRLARTGAIKIGNGIVPSRDDMEGPDLPAAGRVLLSFNGVIAAVAEVVPEGERGGVKPLRLVRVFNQLYPLH